MFPKNVSQLPETLFDKVDAFDVLDTDAEKLFNIMAIFNCVSFSVEDDECKDIDTTRNFKKNIPTSISISPNF